MERRDRTSIASTLAAAGVAAMLAGCGDTVHFRFRGGTGMFSLETLTYAFA